MMRHTLFALLVVAACSGAGTDIALVGKSLPPIPPDFTPSFRIVPNAGRSSSLEVIVSVRNRRSTPIFLVQSGKCPLQARLFANPTGASSSSTGGFEQCPTNTTTSLAPGDSILLTVLFPPESLAVFSPGLYGIDMNLTTSTSIIGTFVGNVRLPLDTPR